MSRPIKFRLIDRVLLAMLRWTNARLWTRDPVLLALSAVLIRLSNARYAFLKRRAARLRKLLDLPPE